MRATPIAYARKHIVSFRSSTHICELRCESRKIRFFFPYLIACAKDYGRTCDIISKTKFVLFLLLSHMQDSSLVYARNYRPGISPFLFSLTHSSYPTYICEKHQKQFFAKTGKSNLV